MDAEIIIKWGFIGCGEVTEKKSGPAFSLVPGSKIEAVMSRNKEKARSYAERHGIPKWYTDAQELVDDPDVNAVYIATPPSSHATFAIMAMKAGKPVYVEKPLAVSYEECCRINRVSQQTGVPCFVAYYRRYLPYFAKVKELIRSGAIGRVLNVQIRFAVPPRDLDYNSRELPWRVQRDIAGGGYFYDLARISWICFRNFSGPSSKPKGTVPTGKDYTPRKTTSVPVSNSRTVRRAPVHGVSWPMNRPKPTVSKSSATKDRFVSRYSPTTPLPCIRNAAAKNSSYRIPTTCNFL